MLAVQVIAPIDAVAMSLGSASKSAVIRLGDHFRGDGGGLAYRFTNRSGYVDGSIDAQGSLTLRASSTVPVYFVTANDVVTVRATSKTDAGDFRELTFDVFQKAAVRVGNALAGMSGGALVASATQMTAGSAQTSLVSAAPVPRPSVAGSLDSQFGDFNGDFAEDVAWFDSRGRIWVSPAVNNTEFRSVSQWGTLPAGQQWQTIKVGDFNADGRADVAARSARTGAWWVAMSTGTGFSAARAFGTWPRSVPWDQIVVADFDGNGTSDIAGRNPYTGQWYVSRSDGTRFATASAARFTPGLWGSFTVADFTGDGRADIAARNTVSGAWSVAVSEGARFASPRAFGTWSKAVRWTDMRVGDFDHDGRADIAARNPKSGDWIVARSTGSSFVTTSFGGFGRPVKGETIVAGDFNNDGKTDIASRDPRTGFWRMLASEGPRFAAPVAIGAMVNAPSATNIRPLRIGYRQTNPVSSGSFGVATGTLALANLIPPTNTGSFANTGTLVLNPGNLANPGTIVLNPGNLANTGTLVLNPGTLVASGTSLFTPSPPGTHVFGVVWNGNLTTAASKIFTASGEATMPPGEMSITGIFPQSGLPDTTRNWSGVLRTSSGTIDITSGTLTGRVLTILSGRLSTESGVTPITSGSLSIEAGMVRSADSSTGMTFLAPGSLGFSWPRSPEALASVSSDSGNRSST